MEYKWTALTVTAVGTLMAGIDTRIVVVGLPTIAAQLHADAESIIWITQGYVLAGTVGLLLVGKFADLFGKARFYNLGFIFFTVGSILSAISFNSYEVIASRLIQGVGGGILLTISSSIITDASPREELGKFLGLNQMAYKVGNLAGLTLSGLILAVVDWRGLFYVNIPIGIVGIIWAKRRLRDVGTKDSAQKIDWMGFSLFSSGLTFVLLAITFLSYGFTGYLEGYALLGVGVILVLLFIKVESIIPDPMLDLRLFKIRMFAMGNIAQIINSFTWGGLLILIAFYLQIGLGYTPLQAGVGILPMDATYLGFTYVGGRVSDRYGSRGVTTLGILLMAVSFFAMWAFGTSTSYFVVAALLSLIGVGNGLFTAPNLREIMGSVPPNRTGIASGFRNTMFQVGLVISYGLVILFITIGIPYGPFSQLLQGVGSPATLALERLEFLNGFRIAVLILAIMEALAIIPSAMRGPTESEFLVHRKEAS